MRKFKHYFVRVQIQYINSITMQVNRHTLSQSLGQTLGVTSIASSVAIYSLNYSTLNLIIAIHNYATLLFRHLISRNGEYYFSG